MFKEEIREKTMTAYHLGNGQYDIFSEDGISERIATINVTVKRERKSDLTGEKEFKISTQTTIHVEALVAHGQVSVSLGEYTFWEGPTTAIRELIAFMQSENWKTAVRINLENLLNKAGVDRLDILEAGRELNSLARLYQKKAA